MTSRQRISALTRHEVRVLRTSWMAYLLQIVVPVVVVTFLDPTFRLALLAKGDRVATSGAELGVPDVAVMFSFFLVGVVGFSFVRDRGCNTWNRLRLAARPGEILLSKTLPLLVWALTQQLLLYLIGVSLLGMHVRGNPWALLPTACALGLFLIATGVCGVAVLRTLPRINALQTAGTIVLGGASGALAPLWLLPSWVRTVAPGLPTYWALHAYRAVVLDGAGLHKVLPDVAILLGAAAVMAAVALRCFHLDEAQARWW